MLRALPADIRLGSRGIAHRRKSVAEVEGKSVVFFAIPPWLRMVEGGSAWCCRFISYARDCVLRRFPLSGEAMQDNPSSELASVYII